MYRDMLVQTNIKILRELKKESKNIEELADSLHIKTGRLSTPLKILTDQGIVIEKDGNYLINLYSKELQVFTDITDGWYNYFNVSYMEIAKDVAEAIITKSWKDVRVQDVVLFGSTLTQEKPNDIDMIILHDGHKLKEFSWDPYNERKDWKQESDSPVNEDNKRIEPYQIFCILGYNLKEEDSALGNIEKIVNPLGIHKGDFKAFEALFDINVLSTELFDIKSILSKKRREEAIECCRDPTFWYTILREGMLYNRDTHDFSIKISDKYPNALDLFEIKT